jgi:hypothetical protein
MTRSRAHFQFVAFHIDSDSVVHEQNAPLGSALLRCPGVPDSCAIGVEGIRPNTGVVTVNTAAKAKNQETPDSFMVHCHAGNS